MRLVNYYFDTVVKAVLLLLLSSGIILAQVPYSEEHPNQVDINRAPKDVFGQRDPLVSNFPFQVGDVFTAVASGRVQHYDGSGNLLGTLNTGLGGFTTGMATDADGNLYVTNFSLANVSRFSGPAVPHVHSLFLTADPSSQIESILFDAQGNIYVGQAGGTADILKYDSLGTFLARFDVAGESRGSDWIDLDADQRTMYYTSEGQTVKRFDVAANVQLPDFATGLPGSVAYALRLLPGGGLLIADTEVIVRLDSLGTVVQTYDAPAENSWFALNLDPDGFSFWSGNFSTGNFYKFDIASGNILLGPINTGTGGSTLFGLTVFGEIAVGQNNRPTCTINPPGPFVVDENQSLTFDVSATDPDAGDIITLDVVGGLPSGATMTPALPLSGAAGGVSSTFNWTPGFGQAGSYQVTYMVSDSSGATDTCFAQIDVNPVNVAPTCQITPPGPFVLNEGDPLTFTIFGADLNPTDNITLDVSGLPGGATMTPPLPLTGPASGVSSTFDWTPASGQAGSYTVTYTVTDDSLAQSVCTVEITVNAPVNNPPLCQVSPPGPFVIVAGTPLTFDVAGSDPDAGSTVTLDVSGLPSGATMTPALPLSGPGTGVTSTFDWTPSSGQTGSFTVTYSVVDDQGASDTCTVLINVTALPNNPPVCQVTPPGPFTINEGDPLSFLVSGSDPDAGSTITLSVSGLPAGAAMTPALPLSGPGTGLSSTFDWTPGSGQAGGYTLTYVVVDEFSASDTCTVQITVNSLTPSDTLAPVCQVVNVDPGPPMSADIAVQDLESGLASIEVVRLSNATVEIPAGSGNFYNEGDVVIFSPATNDLILSHAVKIDNNSAATVLFRATDADGNFSECDPIYTVLSASTPDAFELKQNFPNPFNPSTTINFNVIASDLGNLPVTLKIYDISGREVKTLVNESLQSGHYAVEWDGTNNQSQQVAGGIYIYRITAGTYVATRKMVLLK